MGTYDAESIRPDLNGTTCTIADCGDVADTIGVATLRLPVIVGHPGDELVLEVLLCTHHAHLLRMGVDACAFDSRLD